MSLFTKPVDEYVRDVDIMKAYQHNLSVGMAKLTGLDLDVCSKHIELVTAKDGRLEFEDKPMKYVGRDVNGDRELKLTTFLKYIKNIDNNNLILSPSLTAYLPPSVTKSVTAIFLDKNIQRRNKSKGEMFKAAADKNDELTAYKGNEQLGFKLANNSESGARCSKSTPLFLNTIHSSLTSTCRAAAGYGNANNEKLIAGNRHYWSPDIVEANILAIVTNVNLVDMEEIIEKFNLSIPTVNDALECVVRGSDVYWRDVGRMNDISNLLASLSSIEIAAFVYIGDLYHIAKHNDEFMRNMLDRLSSTNSEVIENPKSYIKLLNDEMEVLVSLLCGDLMGGKSISNFDDFSSDVQMTLGATSKRLLETLNFYEKFIKVIMVSDIMPSSIANLPTIVRRCAITSDTDSTIFTVQDWIKWYSGKISFEKKGVAVGHAIAFFAAGSITHLLALMSANMGVPKEQIHQYEMKSEFYFPVFSLTSRAKTYFASIGAQEGQIKNPMGKEIKGAVFKGSQLPKFITSGVKDLMDEILDSIYNDKKISITDVLKNIATVEYSIRDSIIAGDVDFFKRSEIKPKDSYKLGETSSPYFQFLLWKNVFAAKYGHVNEPPYVAIKVSLDTDNKSSFLRWINSMEDAALRERLVLFLKSAGKDKISLIQIPKAIVDSHGVPKEIINGISIRRIVANLMEPYYAILETLGYYTVDKHQLRLISDAYTPIVDK